MCCILEESKFLTDYHAIDWHVFTQNHQIDDHMSSQTEVHVKPATNAIISTRSIPYSRLHLGVPELTELPSFRTKQGDNSCTSSSQTQLLELQYIMRLSVENGIKLLLACGT